MQFALESWLLIEASSVSMLLSTTRKILSLSRKMVNTLVVVWRQYGIVSAAWPEQIFTGGRHILYINPNMGMNVIYPVYGNGFSRRYFIDGNHDVDG